MLLAIYPRLKVHVTYIIILLTLELERKACLRFEVFTGTQRYLSSKKTRNLQGGRIDTRIIDICPDKPLFTDFTFILQLKTKTFFRHNVVFHGNQKAVSFALNTLKSALVFVTSLCVNMFSHFISSLHSTVV